MQLVLGIWIVNPLLLFGAGAVALPIAIHLLARRGYRVVEWAAMAFLVESHLENRRRIKIEHLVLLMLRCLIVLLIVVLVSRVYVSGASLIGGERVERVFVLDDSPSMGMRVGSGTVFDAGVDTVIEYVRGMSGGDIVTVILTSEPGRVVIDGVYAANRDEIIGVLEGLRVSDVRADIAGVLMGIEKRMDGGGIGGGNGGGGNCWVYVVSDTRCVDWVEYEDDKDIEVGVGGRVFGAIGRIREKAAGVRLIDVGIECEQNITVAGIEVRNAMAVAGVETRFDVRVVNNGSVDARGVEVSFGVDDGVRMREVVDFIGAGDEARVWFGRVFDEAGWVGVCVEVGSDVMAADNERYLAACIDEGIGVLLIDGEWSEEPGESETFFLRHALEPTGEVKSGNIVEVVRVEQLRSVNLQRYDVVVLANVAEVDEEFGRELREWVEGGGGLLLAMGDRVNGARYNEVLGGDGVGLLGMRAGEIVETGEDGIGFGEVDWGSCIMRGLPGKKGLLLNGVRFGRWWSVDDVEGDVVARLNDDEGSELMVEWGIGDGRVVVLTSGVDGEWGNWQGLASYVVVMNEMVRGLAEGGDDGVAEMMVGNEMVLGFDASVYGREAELRKVGDGGGIRVVAGVGGSGDVGESNWMGIGRGSGRGSGRVSGRVSGMVLRYDGVRSRGLYEVALERHDGTRERRMFAANIDWREGDLARIESDELARRLGDVDIEVAGLVEVGSGGVTGGRWEIWRVVVVVLIVVLFIEQCVAWWFGRGRWSNVNG